MEDVQSAEQALVGLLALDPGRVGEVAGWLSPSDFAVPAAGLLFARLLELHASGRHEPGALLELLRARGELRRDGYPVSALMRWWDTTPVPGQPAAYGRLVVAGQVARQLNAAGVRLVQVACSGGPARALSMVLLQRSLLTAARRRLGPEPSHSSPMPTRSFVAPQPRPAGVEQDVEYAELVTVGAVVVSPAASAVGRWLSPGDFSSAEIGEVFGAAISMRLSSRPVDRVTVVAELRARGSEADAGLVARCEAAVPVAASVGFYARRVLAASVRQQVEDAGTVIARLGEDRPGGTAAAVDAAIARLDGLSPLASRLRIALGSSAAVSAPETGRSLRRTAVPARW